MNSTSQPIDYIWEFVYVKRMPQRVARFLCQEPKGVKVPAMNVKHPNVDSKRSTKGVFTSLEKKAVMITTDYKPE